ncbi:MAG: hypothetical protein Q4D38_08645, partial [Planctomycetia bacterium]|nr:hypothetical protein [Planctomycetia bacterium]
MSWEELAEAQKDGNESDAHDEESPPEALSDVPPDVSPTRFGADSNADTNADPNTTPGRRRISGLIRLESPLKGVRRNEEIVQEFIAAQFPPHSAPSTEPPSIPMQNSAGVPIVGAPPQTLAEALETPTVIFREVSPPARLDVDSDVMDSDAVEPQSAPPEVVASDAPYEEIPQEEVFHEEFAPDEEMLDAPEESVFEPVDFECFSIKQPDVDESDAELVQDGVEEPDAVQDAPLEEVLLEPEPEPEP